MNCYSCGEQRNNLHPVGSKLIKDVTNLLCTDCKDQRFEPRHLIILVGRSSEEGRNAIKPYILQKRYVGEPILAEELA